jgi:hypothetical protein
MGKVRILRLWGGLLNFALLQLTIGIDDAFVPRTLPILQSLCLTVRRGNAGAARGNNRRKPKRTKAQRCRKQFWNRVKATGRSGEQGRNIHECGIEVHTFTRLKKF